MKIGVELKKNLILLDGVRKIEVRIKIVDRGDFPFFNEVNISPAFVTANEARSWAEKKIEEIEEAVKRRKKRIKKGR